MSYWAPTAGLRSSAAGQPAAIPEGRVRSCLQQQAHSLSLPRTCCHMKQGAAAIIHRLVEQGVVHIQGLCALPILMVPWQAPALWHTQEVPQCPHVPCFAGSKQGITELGLRVSYERRIGGESDSSLGRVVLWSDQKTHRVQLKHHPASWAWALQDFQHLQSL